MLKPAHRYKNRSTIMAHPFNTPCLLVIILTSLTDPYRLFKRTPWLYSYNNYRYSDFRAKHSSSSSSVIYKINVKVCVRLCIYLGGICVSSKNAAVYCLTARRLSWNSSQQLGCWIFILWKTPAKSRKSPVACYGHVFLLATSPIRTFR